MVTAPLERQLGQMPSPEPDDLRRARRAPQVLTLQFGLDLSLDVGEQEVQAATNAAGSLLPSDLPSPPTWPLARSTPPTRLSSPWR